jgi:HEAT repeat protein
LAALLDDATGGATADIITALADLEGEQSADALGYLLGTPNLNPMTHWLVARHLTTHPAGEAVMLRGLQHAAIDPFTRGALAEGLGQRHAISAVTPLRHLAENPQTDPHLRSQALLGLGLLDDPTTETILTRLIGDPGEDLTLRGLAAEYLPQQLSTEGRRFLRDLLRADRTPAPLVIGALRTLGRVRDREALSLLLRYCLGETTEIAQAAIDALADLGDGSVAPVLVRISQQHGADHALRLQAVSALLRIGGEGYLPLLRVYLHQGALPFRMLALEALLGSRATTADLLPILSTQSWPTAMRLRLIDYFASDPAAAPALIGLLDTPTDEPQLRILAAETLGRLRYASAAPALIRQAQHHDTPPALRLACVASLHKLNAPDGWAALSQLASDPGQPDMLRERAQRALCEVVSA